MVEALTINESSFFRDGHPFDHLRRALPRIAAVEAGHRVRYFTAADLVVQIPMRGGVDSLNVAAAAAVAFWATRGRPQPPAGSSRGSV